MAIHVIIYIVSVTSVRTGMLYEHKQTHRLVVLEVATHVRGTEGKMFLRAVHRLSTMVSTSWLLFSSWVV